jgi:hypothetical protein
MSSRRPKPEKIDLPPLLRFILWVGKPMGVAYVPIHHLQVIYRMGKYVGCKGPGLITYNRLTETLGPLVGIAAQTYEYEFDQIISRDVLPVKVRLAAIVEYDPSSCDMELASILTRMPRENYLTIAGTFLRWALLAIANQYNASELTQQAVRAQIEDAAQIKVNDELAYLGLRLRGKLRILAVELPARLADRHETIAQRRASILAGAEFHPAEYRRALVSEVIETMGRRGESEAFLNFNEMLETVAEDRAALPPPPNIIEVPDETANRPAPPPAEPPPSRPEPRPTQPRSGRRPKSRL